MAITGSFLPQIDAAFTEPLSRYGFVPVKRDWVGEPYYYDLVRYQNGERVVRTTSIRAMHTATLR
jgi:hypothetical protein